MDVVGSNNKERLDGRLGQLVQDLHKIAKKQYDAALAKSGVEYSGQIRQNFERGLLEMSKDYAASVTYSFGKYGRFRDLKFVQYEGYQAPNNKGKKYSKGSNDDLTPEAVRRFEEWITATGLQKFKYVPGFVNKQKKPSTTIDIKKMAWGMYLGRLWKGKVPNKRTQWYSKSTSKIIKDARPLITEQIARMLTDGTYSRLWEDMD